MKKYERGEGWHKVDIKKYKIKTLESFYYEIKYKIF